MEIFVGYDKESPAYSVYYPESMKVEQVRRVTFLNIEMLRFTKWIKSNGEGHERRACLFKKQ